MLMFVNIIIKSILHHYELIYDNIIIIIIICLSSLLLLILLTLVTNPNCIEYLLSLVSSSLPSILITLIRSEEKYKMKEPAPEMLGRLSL